MSDYSVTPYLPDDILIERHGRDSTETVWLREAFDQMTTFCENVLCEANAKEVYDAACILEEIASDLRRKYNIWKRAGFENGDILR